MIEKKSIQPFSAISRLHPVASVVNLSKESCYYSTTLILFFEAAALHHLPFITIDKLIVNVLAIVIFIGQLNFSWKKINEGDPNELNPVKACTFGTADSTEEAASTWPINWDNTFVDFPTTDDVPPVTCFWSLMDEDFVKKIFVACDKDQDGFLDR